MVSTLTPGDAAWLVSDGGRDLVRRARGLLASDPDPLRAATTLRQSGADPERAALALTQAGLRARAERRLGFDLAPDLLLTEDGLAQATRPEVARRRAARLAASGAHHVLDAGCGLGLDARAFAAAGLSVTGVERDSGVAVLAAANLAEREARVVVGDVTDDHVLAGALVGVDAVFVDPARRNPSGPRRLDGSARRITDPARWSPPWPWVEALAARVPRVVAKLAPGIARDLAPHWELVWTSVRGDLVEAAAWSPALARAGVARAAVVLRHGLDDVEVTDADDPHGEDAEGGLAPTGPVGAYLLEPDDAVIRAGLVGAVVAGVGGRLLARRLAYVTCDEVPGETGRAGSRAYRVLDVGRVGVPGLRSSLARLGAGDVVVKQRGMQTDPAALRTSLRLTGDGPTLTVLLARVDDGAVAVVAQPLGSSSGGA